MLFASSNAPPKEVSYRKLIFKVLGGNRPFSVLYVKISYILWVDSSFPLRSFLPCKNSLIRQEHFYSDWSVLCILGQLLAWSLESVSFILTQLWLCDLLLNKRISCHSAPSAEYGRMVSVANSHQDLTAALVMRKCINCIL